MSDPTDSSAEEWRPVPGYEGYYSVSDKGRVMSHHNWREGINRILPTEKVWNGYVAVWLHRKARKRIHCMIHRLVLLAFVGPSPGRSDTNHKNGVKSDNRLSNLQWCTRSENVLHSCRVLKAYRVRGSEHWCSKLTENDVLEIRWLTGRMTGAVIAKAFGVKPPIISAIKLRRNWKHI